ncbi:hypothetical protein [Gelidibacter gilvus]|uniref:Nicotinate-nucleotide adenylyltransferase n=1 Tax=Gelidibacter gilvus TaxID=59602 RepID=A0A4Q0X9P3_9FLAO|nr:hypothetical protein [Gelidibacter gilvus]RXJ43758.1 hypothetical protein ESZ48_18905 [Gelidibacter gilvus]
MKTILVGLFLGLTSLMNAQSFTSLVDEVALNEVVISPYKNIEYYNVVYEPNAPSSAKMLESEVGKYDIRNATVYSEDHDSYEVLFTCEYGNILAKFNDDGELLNSKEEFKGILLPQSVIETLRITYPDWRLNSTEYWVKYNLDKDVIRMYEVQLTKGNKKMNLKIDCKGVILNPKNG